MPFRSESQRRFFYAAEARGDLPEGTAAKWQSETPKGKKLPDKVKKQEKKAMTHRGLRDLFGKTAFEDILPELLLGGGIAGGIGATRGALGSAGPERRDIAEGLQGKERGKLRRAYEHLVNPQGAAAYLQGQALREAVPGQAKGLAEKMHGEYGTGSKVLRALQHVTSPLALGVAPISALLNALKRTTHSRAMDKGLAKGDEPLSTGARAGFGAAGAIGAGLVGGRPGSVLYEAMMSGLHGSALRKKLQEHMGRGLSEGEVGRYQKARAKQ